MAMFKCKMCGGDLNLIEGQSVAECEYCGSRQTVPSADNEKKLNLFSRANRLRAACDFDKAAGIYEAIVADFPEEAESYWGLVLCKYGIEYVDDPATGKKIPTCHRSSFDSVMDDSNFEQAMENADEAALRVYRQEAKQIEEVRKGILEVSSSEKPYDIFICYKETDAEGNRTVDSLLAQDIYDALIGKNYRVFFSRITLEDKLGQAYEPYIFAALNSAKIMLAVGTCYEHYNAVWVKNEWSRYLKIVAQDKGKYLIPCYKGLDAYDMPKEFQHLQGQDMGKVGAIADLLRGIEKLIPRQTSNTVAAQEKIVVGNAGGSNKIASLLDRGNMALEDGDWAKADSFFEDVLNNDSKNAQAYLGKTLAQEKCRTMDALIRKRKDVYQNVGTETLYIAKKTAHINEMAERCSLKDYVNADSIRKLYQFNLSYSSEVSRRQRQYQEEENWWQNHRWLSRAEKFATGTVADTIQNEKKHLFAQLNDRVKKAQEADAKSVAKLVAAYDAHIVAADEQAEKLYEDGLSRRENDYRKWLERAKEENNPETLNKLAAAFDKLGEYKDSKNLAEHCRKRAAEEQDRIDAQNEQLRLIAQQKQIAQKKRLTMIASVFAMVIVLAIPASFIRTKIIIPRNVYKAATALMENGQYQDALNAFKSLGDYKDAPETVRMLHDHIAEETRKANEARRAAEAEAEKERIAAAKKAEEERLASEYAAAEALAKSGETGKAAITFGKLGAYNDARERSLQLWSEVAQQATTISAGKYSTIGLKADGSVVAIGSTKHGRCNVSGWTDISAISAGSYHTLGLKTDGTVVAVGDNEYGQCNVDSWKDIVAVSAGDYHTVGLKADGTIVAVGDNEYGQCNVDSWKDIVAVSAGVCHTVGLKADGSVVATKLVGDNNFGQCDVSDWEDIIAISAGSAHTVGLKADGTVLAVGSNTSGQRDVDNWKDIVAISATGWHTVGLKTDSTVVTTGENNYGQCNVEGWEDISAISAGAWHTIGLKADSTVVAVGINEYDLCDVSGWTNIKLPQ